jgi:hypothetical protein
MRSFLPVCLVFAGLISAAPAFAMEVLRTSVGTFTCQNQCVVRMTDVNGNPTRVEDSQGGTVRYDPVNQDSDRPVDD